MNKNSINSGTGSLLVRLPLVEANVLDYLFVYQLLETKNVGD